MPEEKLSQRVARKNYITDERQLLEVVAIGQFALSGRDAITDKYVTVSLRDLDRVDKDGKTVWRHVVPAVAT